MRLWTTSASHGYSGAGNPARFTRRVSDEQPLRVCVVHHFQFLAMTAHTNRMELVLAPSSPH
eukprot:SAG11_NODE_9274_length_926_cov_3.711004_1_plen_61_part_01